MYIHKQIHFNGILNLHRTDRTFQQQTWFNAVAVVVSYLRHILDMLLR